MNPHNVVDLLTDMVKRNLDLHPPSRITLKEREVAEYFYKTLKSFENTRDFNYQEESTLDLQMMSDNISSDEDVDTVEDNDDEIDDEWVNEDGEKLKRHLKQYSFDYMKAVVDFADEKDDHGKRRHTWKSIHNRF
jgi:hypothetical protein